MLPLILVFVFDVHVGLMSTMWYGPITEAKKSIGHPLSWRLAMTDELHDRHLSQRQRPLAGSQGINCTRGNRHSAHDARTSRTYPGNAQRGRPQSSARSFGNYSPCDHRRLPITDTEQEPCDCAGYSAQEDRWGIEGPGQDLPESVWPSWRGSEERYEVWRLVQDEGDFAQRTRLGVYSWKHHTCSLADWIQIISEIKASGLRGRGGAGFPSGLKWVRDSPST